ncbi:MAG TPA: TonB-dependent receptor [Terriglobales bacterium]
MSRFRPVVLALAFTLLVSLAAFAQTGSIRGTVTDQSGAIVVGADVSARNVANGAVRDTTTNDSGAYSINELQAGVYELSIKKANFKAYLVSKLELTVAQVLSVNATLDTGGEEQTIEVRGDKISDIDLETSQVSNLVDQRKMIDLPLITRDPYSLVLLSPGTMQTNTSLGGFSVNGSRERNNNFMLDGSDNNDTSVPGIPDGVLSANPDSTQEFRVITNNFDAEYGRNTGAIIDVITKSGTNIFHGSAYEYGRWNGFGGARDWFNPGTGPNASPMNPYVRNQFGYSIGGPIKKGKTFFFFNQEIDRYRTATTGSATVPTAAFKTGVFTFTGSAGPQAVDLRPSNPSQNPNGAPLDPTMQSVLALYPNPTVDNSDGFTGSIFFPTGSKSNIYNQIVKLDHHFTDSETLSVSYGYDHNADPDPFHDDILPGGVGATAFKGISESLSANLNSVLTPTLVNDFRFGWNHIYASFACNHTELDSVSPLDQFGKARDYILNPFTSFGCLSLAANGQDRKTGTVSYAEGLSWVHGSHTFKFGGDFRNVGENGSDNFFSRRQVLTDSVTVGGPSFSLVDNIPGATTQLEDAASALYGFVIQDQEGEFFDKSGTRVGSDNKFFRQHEYDGYFQDDWKIRHNLTLNLGIRYQFDGVPFEQNANFSNLLTDPGSFTAGQDVTFSIVGPGTGNKLYQNDFSGIEPRVGFSWDPWGDGKTAVRAGFGIFHDRAFGNLFGNARGNPPFEDDYVNFPLETIGDAFGSGEFPSIAPTTIPSAIVPDGSLISPVIFDPHFRNPVSNNWNLDIQRTVAAGTTLDVAYIGSKGTHIYREMDGNPPDPNLINQLLAICVPGNPQNTTGCTADDVTKGNLFEGTLFGTLPMNAVANTALLQPFYIRSVGNSNYNSLQVKATRQMSHGLEVQGSYTWAHSIDDSGDPIVPGAGNRGFPRNSRDLSEERGNSDDDIRNVAVINYIWQVPLGKGRAYLSHGVMGRVFEGFQFSGITSMQSGIPFDVYSTTDMERTGLSGRADLVGDPFAAGTNPNASQGKVFFTNVDAFSGRADAGGGPLFEGPGTVGRNHFHGPSYVNFNLSLAKQMALTERIGMELRCEAYNIFNHPEFTNPGADPGALGNQLNSPLFGVITSTRSQPDGTTSARQLQVALRLTF